MLEIRSLQKAYGKKTIFEELSFTFTKGLNLVTGPNGSGKTTLLRILSGLERAGAGDVLFDRERIDPSSKKYLKKISVAFSETTSFYQNLTGKENLEFFETANGRRNSSHIYDRVPLNLRIYYDELAMARFHTYSSGMQKKLNLLRAILCESEILFLDEPFAHLDQKAARNYLDCFQSMAKQKVILVATHRTDLSNISGVNQLELAP